MGVIIIVLVAYKSGVEYETLSDDNIGVKELDCYESSSVDSLTATRAELAYRWASTDSYPNQKSDRAFGLLVVSRSFPAFLFK